MYTRCLPRLREAETIELLLMSKKKIYDNLVVHLIGYGHLFVTHTEIAEQKKLAERLRAMGIDLEEV